MGLKRIVGIRQFTGVTPAGKIEKRYEIRYETEKTDGEFTFDLPVDKYTKERALDMANTRANDIDAAIR